MRTVVRRNFFRQHDATSAMRVQVRPGFAAGQLRLPSVNQARKRHHDPAGAEDVSAGDEIASPCWPSSGHVSLPGPETPAALRVHTGAETDTRAGPTNIVHCLREHAAERAADTAFVHLIDGGTPHVSMTYAQLDRRARTIAAHLQDMRLAGQRVVLAYPPGLEFIAAFFGVLYAGCVAVPTYPPRRRTLDRFDAIVERRRCAPRAQHRVLDRPVQGDDRSRRSDPVARHRRTRGRRRRPLDRARPVA